MAKIESKLPSSESGGRTTFHNNLLGLNEGDYIHLTAIEKVKLDNQSGINSGDETTSTIQTKRPLKTVNNQSLEGIGNIQIDYNDLDNLPTIITNHSGLNLDDSTNPHGTTKNDVGLGNVPNLDTTDAVNNEHTHSNKTILDNTTESFITALKNAYDGAVSWITTNGTNLINHLTNTSNPHNVTKSQVGLGSVDNTSDIDKPISTATQIVLDSKLDKVTTVDVEKVYIKNADGTQGVKATSELKEIIEGYLSAGVFYQDALHTITIAPEGGKIYVDLNTYITHLWNGTIYKQINNNKYNKEEILSVAVGGTSFQNIGYLGGVATAGSATYEQNKGGIKYTSTANTNQVFGFRDHSGLIFFSNSNIEEIFWFSKGEVTSGTFLSVGNSGGSGLFVSNFLTIGASFGHGSTDVNFKVQIEGTLFDLGSSFPVSTDSYRVSFIYRNGNVKVIVKNLTNGLETSVNKAVNTSYIIGATHCSGGTLNTSTASSVIINRFKRIKYES